MKSNHKRYLYLGLDTSAYTTSMALVDHNEKLLVDQRFLLPVKKGSLGLRQSEAVFSHILNFPRLWQQERKVLNNAFLAAVACSVRPRPVDESYMPVFKVSEAFGLFLAQTMGLNYLPSSHQEGHVIAGLWSAGLKQGRYLILHLSGGTTEILSSEETEPGLLKLQLLGGTADLNAGQFIDRLGQAMELGFPAGPKLERLASKSRNKSIKLPLAVKGSNISFSGPASHAERLLEQGCSREDLARAIEKCIADSLSVAVRGSMLKANDCQGLLAVGGVSANIYIRSRLKEKLSGWNIFFARPEYAPDNAVGLAVQAARRSGENREEMTGVKRN